MSPEPSNGLKTRTISGRDRNMPNGVSGLLARGKARGYVTWEEVHEALPIDHLSQEEIDDALFRLEFERIFILEKYLEQAEAAQVVPTEPGEPHPPRTERIQAAYDADEKRTLEYMHSHGWTGTSEDLRAMEGRRWRGEVRPYK